MGEKDSRATENIYFDGILLEKKLRNGSYITIGKDRNCFSMYVDKHFSRFQKKMIKWCFGFDVVDANESSYIETI